MEAAVVWRPPAELRLLGRGWEVPFSLPGLDISLTLIMLINHSQGELVAVWSKR